MLIKFFSEAYFSRLEILLMSLKSQTRDPQLKVPPRGLVLKNPLTSAEFEPANLGS